MIVDVPDIGTIEFPDTMPQDQVTAAVKKAHDQRMTGMGYRNTGPLPGGTSINFKLPQEDQGPRTPQGLFNQNPNPSALSPLIGVNPMPESMKKDTGIIGGLEGAGYGLAKLASASTTPAYAALPGIGEIPGVGPAALKTIGLLFGADMVKNVVDNLSTGVTAPKVGEALVDLPTAALLAGHGARGLGEEVAPPIKPSGIRPEDFTAVTPDDTHTIVSGQEVVPPGRRLQNAPINVAPGGTAIRSGTLSPREQAEFDREVQARALHQGGSAQDAMIKASIGKLDQPAKVSPEQINTILGVDRPPVKVKGVQESPNYDKNQELPFTEIWNKQTRQAGIGNFFVRIGNGIHPFDTIQQAEDSFTAARRKSKLSPEEIAKKGPFNVYNSQGQHVGTINSEGQYSVRGFEGSPGEEPPSPTGTPAPNPKGPTPQLGGPQKALPPGAPNNVAAERNPTVPVSGEQPPVASIAKELGLKVKQWPKEVPVLGGTYSLTDPKTGMTVEGLKGTETKEEIQQRFAAKAETPKPKDLTGLQHDLKSVAQAITFGTKSGLLSPEQAQFFQQEGDTIFQRASQGEDVGTAANDLWKKVKDINERGRPNESKTQEEKAGGPKASGTLPAKGVQPKGRGGARKGGGVGDAKVPTNAGGGKKAAVKKDGIGGGVQGAVDKNKSGEAGFIDVGGIVDAVKGTARKLQSAIDSRPNKKDILREKDVADNAAVIVGQRAGKGQEATAKAIFGPSWQQALNATTAAVEAGGDRNKLNQFIAQATAAGDGGKAGLANAKFARDNWNKLQPLIDRNKKWNDIAFNTAKGQGLNVDYRKDYVRHLYDLTKLPQTMLDKFFGSGTGTGGKGYKKERVFETLYDAIEAGYGPAIKSWNSADLLQNRLRTGLQEVNDLQWAKSFAKVKDPTTGQDLISLTEKPGYTPINGLSQKFYVHRGYENIFDAAVAQSALRKNVVGTAALKGIGDIKHAFLAYDTYHASRMSAKAMSIKGNPGYSKGVTLLEYDPSDLKAAVKSGDITQDMADWANKNRPKANLALKSGFNVGRIQASLDADFWQKHNPLGMGTANHWIFEKLTRGAMLESWVVEFDRQKAANTGVPDEEIAKKISRDLNFNFGSIGRQGLLRSKTAQDLARVVFLAPEWFESMAQTELRSMGQVAKIPVTGKVGTLARSTGVLFLSMLAATQVANIASTGHPSWENPKGHQMDAWVPGIKGMSGDRGDGYWVSPFTVPMEITHDIIRYRAEGDSPLATAGQIVGNKLAPIPRALGTLYTRRDFAGRPMTDKETYKAAALDVLPLPLAAQAPIKGEPIQRQMMAMIGIKGEPAQSPRERMAQYARQFNEDRGVKEGVYPQSDYTKLLNLIRQDKVDDAKKEYNDVIQKKVSQGNTQQASKTIVEKYFTELPEHIYTGQKTREEAFFNALDESGKKDYELVRSQNKAISEEFFSRVLEQGPKLSKRAAKKRFSAFTYENQ